MTSVHYNTIVIVVLLLLLLSPTTTVGDEVIATTISGEVVVRPDRMWMTKQGYVVYETDRLEQVIALCRTGESDEEAALFRSCAFWAKGQQPPNSTCYVVVWRDHVIDGEKLLDHELRHCREGAFHEEQHGSR